MKLKELWKDEYKNEIERAIIARSSGNEAMARVCARRAAGIVIGEYLQRCDRSNLALSAYDRISLFISLPEIRQNHKDIASHFLLKVNSNHKLPLEADLITEVIWLEKSLLSDEDG